MSEHPWLPLAAGSGVTALLGIASLASEDWFQGFGQLGVAGGMMGLWFYNIKYRDPQIAQTNADAVRDVGTHIGAALKELKEQTESDNRELRADLRESHARFLHLLEQTLHCPTKPFPPENRS